MIKKTSTNHEVNDEQALSEEEILKERLHKAWLLTCEAFGIDPENPSKMEKRLFFAGSFEDHQKYVDEQERILKKK